GLDLHAIDNDGAETRRRGRQPWIMVRGTTAAAFAGAGHYRRWSHRSSNIVDKGMSGHCALSLWDRGTVSPPKLGASPAGPCVGVVLTPVFERDRTIW